MKDEVARMKVRWWVWTAIGITVVLAALATIVLWPQSPPFEFLRGGREIRPIPDRYLPDPTPGLKERMFVLEGDYAKLRESIERELVAAGYRWTGDMTPKASVYDRNDGADVVVYRDVRVHETRVYSAEEGRGWITVMGMFPTDSGALARLREWLGL